MRLAKYFIFLFIITSLSLLYTHQQFLLIRANYSIKNYEERLSQLLDQHEILMYNVLTLKSPGNLENKLIAKNIKFEVPARWQVVQLIESERVKEEVEPSIFERGRTVFLSFFTLKSEAEAVIQVNTDLELRD